jgi:hypothetical protein
MGTLTEIEAAVEGLSPRELQELLQFLSVRLRLLKMPEPREFTVEQLTAWVEQDEGDMRRFVEGT